MRVLRIFHSAVVDAWRERERHLRAARRRRRPPDRPPLERGRHRRGPRRPPGRAGHGPPHAGDATRPCSCTRRCRCGAPSGGPYDVIDIHEEPFALATAEILLLRRLRRQRAPYVLYSAQNIDKRYPPPFRWLERWALRHAAGLSVCNTEAGRICERKGFPGAATLIPLGVDTQRFSPGPGTPGGPGSRHRVRRPARAPQGRRRAAARRSPRSTAPPCASPAPDPRRRRLRGTGARAGHRRPGRAGRLADPGPAARLLPGAGRARRAVDADAGLARAVRPRRRGGDGVRRPGRRERHRRPARRGRRRRPARAAGDPRRLRRLPAALLDDETRAPRAGRSAGVVAGTAGVVVRGRAGLPRPLRARDAGTRPTAQRGVEVVVVAYGRPDLLAAVAASRCCRSPSPWSTTPPRPTSPPCAQRLGVRYLDPGRNGGFGAGVNHALDAPAATRTPTCSC